MASHYMLFLTNRSFKHFLQAAVLFCLALALNYQNVAARNFSKRSSTNVFVLKPGWSYSHNFASNLAAIVIEGVVKDETGAPLPGVTIRVVGVEGKGTVTDAQGRFKITLADPNAKLSFSFIGFEKATVALNGKTQINVVLHPSHASLQEAVVIGYQTQTVRNTTAAVTTISGEEIENLPAPSFANLIQGRAPGVNIQNYTGEPGVRNSFVIRGNSRFDQNMDEAHLLSSPLFIIDGVPTNLDDISTFSNTNTSFLAGINPNNIESIQVLKDAAATAAWGSRGANGVVIIKTKRGKLGKPQFDLNFYTGISQKPELLTTVVGAEERRQKINLLYGYEGYNGLRALPQILTDSLNPAFNNATDWQNLFYQRGVIRNADLSMSAGTNIMNYRLSLNYYNEDGVIKSYGFQRYGLRGNFTFYFSPKLEMRANFRLSRVDRKRGLAYYPTDNVTPIDGAKQAASFFKLTHEDSLNYLAQYNQLHDKNQDNYITGYVSLKYSVLPSWLDYTATGSINTTISQRDYFQPSTLTGYNYAEATKTNNNSYIWRQSFDFHHVFNKVHRLNFTATQSFQRIEAEKSYLEGYNTPSDNIQVVSGVAQKDLSGYSDYKASSLLSWVGQLMYQYNDKYILNATWRADASSRFGKDSKWGYFPSVSVAWLVSDENFMKPLSGWLNFFKLRASYGKSGHQPRDFYAPFNNYNFNQGYYNGVAMVTPSYTNGVTKDSLTWSSSYQWDIGFDAFLFDNNRINLTVDFYRKTNKNNFYDFPLPFYTGFTSLTYNADVNVMNQGLEINLTTRNLPESSPLQWRTNFNVSFNKNQITKLPYGGKDIYGSSGGVAYIFTVGRPTYVWSQMLYRGVYNNKSQIPFNPYTGNPITYFKGGIPVEPGYPIWLDINHDYDVWGDEDRGDPRGDRVAVGNPLPRVTGGFNNSLFWKNWSLNISCTYTLKRDIINTFRSTQFSAAFGNYYSGIDTKSRLVAFADLRLPDLSDLSYWTPDKSGKSPDDQNATFPSINPYGDYFYQYGTFSTMFNEDGSYFRINSIMLSYSLPKGILDKFNLRNLRVYGVLDNVYTFQSASIPDAEAVTPVGVYSGNRYPLPHKMTLGLTLNF